MRPIAIAFTALGLAACARTEAPTNQDLEMNDLPGLEATTNVAANASSSAAMPLPPSIAFTGADGSSLGSLGIADSPAGLTLALAGTAMPPGPHGIHLHAVGKCEGPKFESAGPHWNPADKQHGTDNPLGPHKGDLPNVTVGADGALSQQLVVAGATIAELADADGTALVVHAKSDDGKTDPSGNSGDRIACAVLAAAK